MANKYKSSLHRLVRFFEESRDAWKSRANRYQVDKLQMKTKIRDLERSKNLWKNKYSVLKQELDVLKKKINRKKSQ